MVLRIIHRQGKAVPSAEQMQALRSFAAREGRYWKSVLRESWMNGQYPNEDEAGHLQTLRNTFGPSWLVRFSLKEGR
jgi:hypothetical protein